MPNRDTLSYNHKKPFFFYVNNVFFFRSQSQEKPQKVKVKVLLRVKVKDATGAEFVRCEVKQNADTGIIRIEGGIDWWSNNSAQFRAAIDALKNAAVTKLDVYLNSPGGNVWEANELANILDTWKGDKTLTLGAICASAATNLILPFEKKNVKAYSNITAMMHNPTMGIEGEEKDLLSGAKLLANTKKTYLKKMSARMGISETSLSNKLDATWWMTFQELMDYNLVGEMMDTQGALPQDTAKVFNAYKYENVPAVLNKALGVELLNEEEEEIKTGKSGEEKKPLKPIMKNLIQLLMVGMVVLKNKLTETSSEGDVVAAITQAFAEKENEITLLKNSLKAAEDKTTALNTKVENHNKQMIKALLDVAQNVEKKITVEQRKVYEEQADTLGFEGLQKIVNSIPARQSIKNMLETGVPNSNKKEDEREEPEFTKDENGGRVYNKASNQNEVLHRAMLSRAKAN